MIQEKPEALEPRSDIEPMAGSATFRFEDPVGGSSRVFERTKYLAHVAKLLSVVSSFSALVCLAEACCEERLLRPLRYRTTSGAATAHEAMRAGLTGGLE